MELKLFNDVGDVIGSFDIGKAEGEWNIMDESEAGQLMAELQRRIEQDEEAAS